MNLFSQQFMKFQELLKFGLLKLPPETPPWCGVGQIVLGSNDSRINPHMRAKFGCNQKVVSKGGGGADRHTRTVQTCQVSRITRESHGFWQFIKAHGREAQCSRIFVNLTECCDQGILFFAGVL